MEEIPHEPTIAEAPAPAEPPDGPQSAPAPAAQPKRPGCVSFVLGLILLPIGILMLPCPGPGMVVIATAIGMMGFGAARRAAP